MSGILNAVLSSALALSMTLAGPAEAPEGAFVPTTEEDFKVLVQTDETLSYQPKSLPSAQSVLSAQSVKWDRLYGENRYETMSAVVREGFAQSGWAVLATGNNFPDALGASALAGVLGCPVLISEPNALTDETSSLLRDLGVHDVYIVSGTSAMGTQVESAIEDLGIATHRVAGETRYATNLRTYEAVRSLGSVSRTVVVVSGKSFADALSISPWAYKTGSPIVLTDANGALPAEAVATIKADGMVDDVLIVGGKGVVSDKVLLQLGADYEYTRLAGSDRYDTSAQTAGWETKHGLTWSIPAVATGANFPDALTSAALCGRIGSVLLLGTSTSQPTIQLLYANRDEVSAGNLIGGPKTQPLTDPIGQLAPKPSVLRHDVPWMGQPNSYYCGPTCGYMILSKLGANVSASGESLSVWSVADAMGTSAYGYTSFTDHMFENGMNSWLGANIYTTVHNPSYEEARAAVMRSFEKGYPMVVDEHEHAGGPHFNGHGDGNYSHVMVVDGYNPSTDEVLFADPAAEVYWYGGNQKFWYPSLRTFVETYLAPYPWRDGIGMVCPR